MGLTLLEIVNCLPVDTLEKSKVIMANKRLVLAQGILAVRRVKFAKVNEKEHLTQLVQSTLEAQVSLVKGLQKKMGVNDTYGFLKD